MHRMMKVEARGSSVSKTIGKVLVEKYVKIKGHNREAVYIYYSRRFEKLQVMFRSEVSRTQ